MMKMNVMVAFVALAAMFHKIEAEFYIVGDDLGWTIPPNGASTYAEWASAHVPLIIRDDDISFSFQGEQDVAWVTKNDFHSCNTNNVIWHSPVPVTISFLIEATYYLIGSLPGHCEAGQKIALHWSKPRSANATAQNPSSSAEANSDAFPLKVVSKRV